MTQIIERLFLLLSMMACGTKEVRVQEKSQSRQGAQLVQNSDGVTPESQIDNRTKVHTTPDALLDNNTSNGCEIFIQNQQEVSEKVRTFVENDAKSIIFKVEYGDNQTKNEWYAAVSKDGASVLSISQNYGLMSVKKLKYYSLTTLTIGFYQTTIEVREQPSGCLRNVSEPWKLMVNLFWTYTNSVDEFLSICYQDIRKKTANSRYGCCFRKKNQQQLVCKVLKPNIYLIMLGFLVAAFRILALLISPYFIPHNLYSEKLRTHKYQVKLEQPMKLSLKFCNSEKEANKHDTVLNLNQNLKRFEKCKESLKELNSKDKDSLVIVNAYNLAVNHRDLLTDTQVPVGFWSRLFDAVLSCKVGNTSVYDDCCQSKLSCCQKNNISPTKRCFHCTWLNLWQPCGKISLFILLTLPLCLRIAFYYIIEDGSHLKPGTNLSFRGRLMTHLGPEHVFWIAVYILYLTSFFLLTWPSSNRSGLRGRMVCVAFRSLRALKAVDRTTGFAKIMQLILWPVACHGLYGLLIGFIYWPFVIPVSMLVYFVYSMPLLFLSVYIIAVPRHKPRWIEKWIEISEQKAKLCSDQVRAGGFSRQGFVGRMVEILILFQSVGPQSVKPNCSLGKGGKWNRCIGIVSRILCFLCLWATMVIFTECFAFFLDIAVLTMIGVIANAELLLRHVTIIVLLLMYSWNIFDGVHKAYVKLNKALFEDIQSKVGEVNFIMKCRLCSRENLAFKLQHCDSVCTNSKPDQTWAVENGSCKDVLGMEQDGLTKTKLWVTVKDLIYFLDEKDTPRIPRRVFEAACNIQVSGAPGPIYINHLRAVGELAGILLFLGVIFLIILSLGEKYHLSSESTVLATVVSGFLPFLLRYVFKPYTPDSELSSISFKARLDEQLQDFSQEWPLLDLEFEEDGIQGVADLRSDQEEWEMSPVQTLVIVSDQSQAQNLPENARHTDVEMQEVKQI